MELRLNSKLWAKADKGGLKVDQTLDLLVLITVYCADQMRPVPENDFDTDPAQDLGQNPQSQDGETLLSNSLLLPIGCFLSGYFSLLCWRTDVKSLRCVCKETMGDRCSNTIPIWT